MKFLVLGGSRQLGSAFVRHALHRKHTVTLFNRGRTNPDKYNPIPEGLIIVRGDRNLDLSNLALKSLADEHWDAVIDTCAYTPTALRISLEALESKFKTYLFVSTVSVYQKTASNRITELSPLLSANQDSFDENVTPESYGHLKVRCEECLHKLKVAALIVRPGVITGSEDHTARFKFWVDEVMQKNEVVVPGLPDRVIQLISAQDLSRWMLRALETGLSGVYNCAGPSVSFSELLERCRETLGRNNVSFHWISPEKLLSSIGLNATNWPLWNNGLNDNVSSAKAIKTGLEYGVLSELIKSVHDAPSASNFTVSDKVWTDILHQ